VVGEPPLVPEVPTEAEPPARELAVLLPEEPNERNDECDALPRGSVRRKDGKGKSKMTDDPFAAS
jgi:hypothetical protein